MPKPKPGESRQDFVERCIPIVIDDGTADNSDQAVAICNSIFGERSVTVSSENNTKHQYVLNAIRSRKNRRAEFGYGITTADQYVRTTIEEHPEIKHPQILIKEAEGKLAYANPDMVLVKEDMTGTVASFGELLPEGVQPPEHTLMVFQHVLTTSREDRDKDVLVTDGAVLDPKAPLLWQHMQTMLVGKILATIDHTPDLLRVATVLLDLENDLTNDAAKLIEAEALRISHGFRALEFEERKQEPGDGGMNPGFRITRFEIMEASLVSVPSNIDAVIGLYSSGKLASDFFRTHAKHYLAAARPAQVSGHDMTILPVSAGTQMTLKLGGAEIDITAFEGVDLSDQSKAGAVQAATDLEADPNIPTGLMTRNEMRAAFSPLGSATMDDKPRFNVIEGCKNFQPEMEHLEASQIEYDWAAKFLGCEIKDLTVTGTFVSRIRAGSYFYAEAEIQAEWEKRDQRNLTYDGKQEPLRHDVIALNSKRSQTVMVEGIEFWKLPEDKKLVVKHQKSWGGYEVVIYSKDEGGNEFMEKCWEWVRQNNFLKGEAFSLTGKFIKRKGQKLDDVFLEPENRKALERAIKLINDKGTNMKSRGQVYMGPPGTGKTLSARVLLNNAKCSFIWVSARDFWRTGSVSGICQALDLAAELSPAIVCFEDVDNWMRGHATDLLKTEMDGLEQKGGVMTILTTNYPEDFPDALLDRPGRFHDICEFHLPTEKIRLQMLQRWTVTEQQSTNSETGELVVKELHVAEIDLEELAKKTEGYSGAHMFELTEFAKTLQEEDDDLEMKGALHAAIKKIDDQRELITQNQLSGSMYKPRRGEIDISNKQLCGHYNTKHEAGDMLSLEEFIEEKLGVKGGRVISEKHLKVLKDVHGDLEHMLDIDKLPKGAHALCERCITKLGGVIKAASSGDDEKPKPKPKPGGKPDEDDEKPKAMSVGSAVEILKLFAGIDPVDVLTTCEIAARKLLESSDMNLLLTTKEAIEAILLVRDLDGVSNEYREMVNN